MILENDGSYADMSHTKHYKDGVNHILNQFDFPYSDWSYNILREVNGRKLSNKTINGRIQGHYYRRTDF